MSLENEIEAARRKVTTDNYGMSIGEIATMYEKKELIISPSFQRLFRWESHQKTKFIESVLLGIPIPPLFVFETKNGQWELIDGLQRLSTILEFMGILTNSGTDELKPPSSLSSTLYLPSLEGAKWNDTKKFSKPLQFTFRRARLDIQILKRPSDEQTKFDLFQRLNSGGSIATPQEIRNCAVIMLDENFFSIMKLLADNKDFVAVSRIREAGERTQRKIERVMRFFAFAEYGFDPEYDVEEFVDKHIVKLANQPERQERVAKLFADTFKLLYESVGADALRRFDSEEKKFVGAVGQVALEAIAVGVATNLKAILKQRHPKGFVLKKIKSFWSELEINDFTKAGLSGTKRLSATIKYGQKYFSP